jgi:hypothetical protein
MSMAKGEIVTDYLKALVNTGLYGATVGEVKDRLIFEGIQFALRQGVIPRRKLYFGYERDHEASQDRGGEHGD